MLKTTLPLYAFVAIVYAALVTSMTGELIGPEWLSSFYDSLGSHLLYLSPEVDPDAIKWEGISVNGKVYGYFGPFPAFLRIVSNWFSPEFRGQWSRVSCLIAGLLCVFSFGTMVSVVTAENHRLSELRRQALCATLIFAFAFGTPVAYLVSCARVYHEAILWGLCGSMGCLSVVGALVVRSPKSHLPLLLFSCAAFVALLSRVTFGIPVVIASPIIFALGAPVGFINPLRDQRVFPRRVLSFTPILGALLVGAWYNYARFGSPVKFIDFAGTYVKLSSVGGTFNPLRIPDALRNYMAFSAEYFMSSAPYARLLTASYERPGVFLPDWREESISYTVAAIWLVVLALAGSCYIWRMERRALVISYALCLLIQALLILSFYFVTQRYSSELLPLLCLLAIPWLFFTRFSRWTAAFLGLLVMFSVCTTMASTLDWNMIYNGDSTLNYKRALRSIFMPARRLSTFAGKVTYLSDMEPISEEASFTPRRLDRNVDGEWFDIAGEVYPKGLGVHAHSRLTYAVPASADGFSALLSPSASELKCARMSYRMRVLGPYDRVLFESGVFHPRSVAVPIDVDVRGLSTITLEVDSPNDSIDCDHANWVSAQFRSR
jgi:hypothetical protein